MHRDALIHATVITGAAMGAMLCTSDTALAQFGFSPEMVMDRLDQNEDGTIDPEEMAESRMPIANMAQQAGIDAAEGLSSDDVEKIVQHMQQQMQQGGGFGGGRGGRGRAGGFGRGGFGRGNFGQDGNGDTQNQNSDRRSKPVDPPPRVTMDLQEDYRPGDSNGDGQIALSEWLRWKGRPAIAEFFTLDRNVDGILTPQELARAGTASPVDLTQIFPTAHPSALPQTVGGTTDAPAPTFTATAAPATTRSQPAAATTTANASTPAVSTEEVERHDAAARRSFKILDRNRDGSIGDLEWNRSRRLRPKFVAAGADLTKAMSEEEFVAYYLKFSATESSD